MAQLSLSLADGASSMLLRPLSVLEIVSTPYEVSLMDLSDDVAPSSEAIIAQPAQLCIDANIGDVDAGPRVWTGICAHIEETHATPGGFSTYEVQIVPALWFAASRGDQRPFGDGAAPELVEGSLSEWKLARSGDETVLSIRPTTVRFNATRRLTLFCVGRSEQRRGDDPSAQLRRPRGVVQARAALPAMATRSRGPGGLARTGRFCRPL